MEKWLVKHGTQYREPGATLCHLLSDKTPPNIHALTIIDRHAQLATAAVWLLAENSGLGDRNRMEIFRWRQPHTVLFCAMCIGLVIQRNRHNIFSIHEKIKKTPFSQASPSNLLGHGQGGGGDKERCSMWCCHYHFRYLFFFFFFFFLTGCAVWVKALSQKWEKLLFKVQPLSSWNLENGHWRGRSKLGTKMEEGPLVAAVVVGGSLWPHSLKEQLVVSGSWVIAEGKLDRLTRGNTGPCRHPKKVKNIYRCKESSFEHPHLRLLPHFLSDSTSPRPRKERHLEL